MDDLVKQCNFSEEDGSKKWGTGGMATKLKAAQTAMCAGIDCVLVNGANPERILEFVERRSGFRPIAAGPGRGGGDGDAGVGEEGDMPEKQRDTEGAEDASARDETAHATRHFDRCIGTYFHALRNTTSSTLSTQRRWVMALPVKGRILVDEGAARALLQKKSLLAIGIVGVSGGDFERGDCVEIFVVSGHERGSERGSVQSSPQV